MINTIFASYPSVAYKRVLREIIDSGYKIRDEHGGYVIELPNVVTQIKSPMHHRVPEGCGWTETALEVYANQLLNPLNAHGHDYTYGNRLRSPEDQLEYCINKIIEFPETRRAIMTTWQPQIDNHMEHVPCMIFNQFTARDDMIHIHATFRSQDAYKASFANVYGLSNMLREVAEQTGYYVGNVTLHVVAAHVYEEDVDDVMKVIV
ncbi:MAG: thymidylate synthase [Gammaproteobacteria bacterium]|nr:thymidylate synthase [Gammaproteobacteria bacterium]